MEALFKKTKLWQLLLVYFVANVATLFLAIPIRSLLQIDGRTTEEILRALMYACVFIWFIGLVVKNKVAFKHELVQAKKAIDAKQLVALLTFNYSVSITIVFLLLLGATLLTPVGTAASSSMPAAAEASSQYLQTIINFFASSFLVPITEELMFRGVLLNQLMGKYSLKASIIISSILFGLIHMQLATLGAAIFGVCMCLLYLKTKNIFVPVILHTIHNTLLSILGSSGTIFGISPLQGLLSTEISLNAIIICAIGGTVMLVISFMYLSRKFGFFSLEKNLVK